MPRSEAVRQECLRLDWYRCQVCGYDGREEQFRPWVVPHHGVAEDGRKLGMGGSDEQDRVENTITLCSANAVSGFPPNRRPFLGPDEGSCHAMVEADLLRIVRWERPQLLNYPEMCCDTDLLPEYGPGVLEVLDVEQRVIPHDRLWFYRKADAIEGEAILSQLSAFALLDSTIAERVHRLGQVVTATDPEARSLRECLASKGLDARRLLGAADLWEKSLDGFAWPEGMTVTDYRRMRRDAGLVEPREYFYAMIPHSSHRRKLKKRGWLTGRQPVIRIRTAYEQELRDMMERKDELEKTGKFVWGNRADGGKLYDPERNEVPVVHFVPKEREDA